MDEETRLNLLARLGTLQYVIVDTGTGDAMSVLRRLSKDIQAGSIPREDKFWGVQRID